MNNLPLELEQQFLRDWNNGVVSDDQLYKQYKNLIRFFISKKVDPRYRDDCFQECCIALFNVAKEYDYREVKFSTFLLSQLRGITTQVSRDERNNDKHIPLDGDGKMWFDAESTYSNVPHQLMVEPEEIDYFADKLKIAIASLNEREKKLIYLKYFEEMDTNSIAKLIHIPRGSLRNLENKALAKMKLVICPELEEESISKIDAKMEKFKIAVASMNFDDI